MPALLTRLRQLVLPEAPKVFCLSFQRTGTTSVGKFFEEHGYRWAHWGVSQRNQWTSKWFAGDYEAIFQSPDFRSSRVFEDDPWWCLDFYKVLHHRFPTAKFVLLERASDRWFDSMVSHSKGRTLGNTHRHSRLYRREQEYDRLPERPHLYSAEIDNLLPLDESHRAHYQAIYELRNREIKEFFHHFSPESLFCGQLEDPGKWVALGAFFGIPIAADYVVHENRTASTK